MHPTGNSPVAAMSAEGEHCSSFHMTQIAAFRPAAMSQSDEKIHEKTGMINWEVMVKANFLLVK